MDYKVKITKTQIWDDNKLKETFKGKNLVKVNAVVQTDFTSYHSYRWFIFNKTDWSEYARKHSEMSGKEILAVKKQEMSDFVEKAKEMMVTVFTNVEPPLRTNDKTKKDYFKQIEDSFIVDETNAVIGIK